MDYLKAAAICITLVSTSAFAIEEESASEKAKIDSPTTPVADVSTTSNSEDGFATPDQEVTPLEETSVVELEVETAVTDQPDLAQTQAEAFEELASALADHPEMGRVNLRVRRALNRLQRAQVGGNPVEISFAEQSLRRAKATRFGRASSIPELTALIERWKQVGAEKVPLRDENDAETSNSAAPSAMAPDLSSATKN